MTRVAAALLLAAAAPALAQDAGSLDSLLDAAGAYVAGFKTAFSNIVAEEHYLQTFNRPQGDSPFGRPLGRDGSGGSFAGAKPGESIRRTLRSDYLLARTPSGDGWIPFRDVFEVDGTPVRDREERLTRLFVNPSGDAFGQADRIVADSARYNIGEVNRNINLPTLAVLLLEEPLRSRFEWKVGAPAGVLDPAGTIRLQFHERARPTLIRGAGGRDLPLRGRIRVADDGSVSRTELVAEDQSVSARIVVTYRHDAALGMLVPGEMQERYTARQGSGLVAGTATYSNFRRFNVAVTEEIVPPRKPPG